MEKNSNSEQKKKVIFMGLTMTVLMVIIGVSYALQKKRISSAKRLYSSGISLETIIECLSLSSKESKLLKKDLGI